MHDPIEKMVAIIAIISVTILCAHLKKIDSHNHINHTFTRDALHKISTQSILFQPGRCVVVTLLVKSDHRTVINSDRFGNPQINIEKWVVLAVGSCQILHQYPSRRTHFKWWVQIAFTY